MTTYGPTSYFDMSRIDELDAATGDLVRRRRRAMGPAYRLFYEAPIEFVRGEGVHLYDSDGVEYLDAYNNVPSVGHSHPRVTAAVSQQLANLNTHTRYLHRAIIDYSEDLLSTLPASLSSVMYTCTGSEAVDLALRLAKTFTGATGVIVTDNAYHGVTTEVAAISPSLGGPDLLADWTRTVRAPFVQQDFDRGVGSAITDLRQNGHGVAAVIADSIFASDGVLADATLRSAVALVRAAGGLYIADEVQPGFGRTGTSFWRFEELGEEPDLMVIGKPMGNGIPIAAVVARPEILDAFTMRYFNTFGGNPVSIAAAQATLDVLREEELQANAAYVGSYLAAQLRDLSTRHDRLGEVRAAGLYLGVDVVDPSTGGPDEASTLAIINGMRRRHVLVGTAAATNSVLKIRPPLPFSTAHADRLVEALATSLADPP